MKKSLFLAVFLLMTSMSFANVVKDNVYPVIDNGAAASLENLLDTFTTDDSSDDICYASCYAEITYEGEYVTTVRSSATAGDCVTAQTNCLQDVKRKAEAYIAAALVP